MNTVSPARVVTASEVADGLSLRVAEALGEPAGAAKVGLLAVSVGVGLGVWETIMAEEVDELCGPRGRHGPDRGAYRHGAEDGSYHRQHFELGSEQRAPRVKRSLANRFLRRI
ncbi:hypothetical protein [Conexibacter sp. S30A1]|uniref:hypothetical protein n=1 Tax=Conexibacter sp. S30A1 TaxID=2937800 RepID=UPI00200C36A2|nr:hypothetical protein [Conexibacter sp. S30A1]